MNSFEEERLKMRDCVLLILSFLGLFCNKVSPSGNSERSTKVYYVELQIEAEAYRNVTELLNTIQVVNDTNPARVTDLSITTDCQFAGTRSELNCTCQSNNIWSCDDHPDCCDKESCIVKDDFTAMCYPAKRVIVNGTIIMTDKLYDRQLANPNSEQYRNLSTELTVKLKAVYSRLDWFDSLVIVGFRPGSVIGLFKMSLNSHFSSHVLTNKTIYLGNNLNSTFKLVTIGIVKIASPSETVLYGSQQNITCRTTEKMDSNGTWYFSAHLKDEGIDIRDGTEADLVQKSLSSTVILHRITEIWKGTYVCIFQSGPILHKAYADLDVALLPNVQIISIPQFPSCKDPSRKTVYVVVQCVIGSSTENYTVKWEGDKETPRNARQENITSVGLIFYKADTTVYCNENDTLQVSCKFTNRKDQTKNATFQIPVIYPHSVVCKASGEWMEAKASHTAQLTCGQTTVGIRTRFCSDNGTWQEEQSNCVNNDLQSLLEDTKNLERGLGDIHKIAGDIFYRLENSTNNSKSINSLANINASVDIFTTMYNVSARNDKLNQSILPRVLVSASNLLNETLKSSWVPKAEQDFLAINFLYSVEGLINNTNVSTSTKKFKYPYVELTSCTRTSCDRVFNTKLLTSRYYVSSKKLAEEVQIAGFKNLADYLPKKFKGQDIETNSIVLSTIIHSKEGKKQGISIDFNLTRKRIPNHKMYCVFWSDGKWSDEGCVWNGPENPNNCECNHQSAFTILMSKHEEKLLFMVELTYAGLGVSICSLLVCLVIEFLVWNTVVKSNVSHFRHTALVNISLCLLIADCTFLASANPESVSENWCLILVVVKHFSFLSMFFWMLCLSVVLLHQMIFIFHQLRKKVYLWFSFSLGYVCPLLIVAVTYITFENGAEDSYYTKKTCWLRYEGTLKGSIHAFIMPIGTVVIINMLSMVVVISKLLKPSVTEGDTQEGKDVAKSILKAVVLLTPIFGVTWIFGFFVLTLDLTKTPFAQLVNYAFTFFNSFQGFFILLTACFGEKKVRDALLNRLNSQKPKTSQTESSTKFTSSLKKK